MHLRATLAIAVAVVVLSAGPSPAAEQRASLPDVEDEVMCVQCKTPLNLSTAPVADRERAFIRREIARGQTKQQIKDSLVDEFGPAVLAVPQNKGFGVAAWLVPLLVVSLALAAVLVTLRRWRARGAPVGSS